MLVDLFKPPSNYTDLFSFGNKYKFLELQIVVSICGKLKCCMCVYIYMYACVYVYTYTLEKHLTSAEMRH